MRDALEQHKDYVATSIDGLTYAWETYGKLVSLHREVRRAASLRSERRTITSADIIGSVRRVTY